MNTIKVVLMKEISFGERKAASNSIGKLRHLHAEGCLPSPEDDEGSRLGETTLIKTKHCYNCSKFAKVLTIVQTAIPKVSKTRVCLYPRQKQWDHQDHILKCRGWLACDKQSATTTPKDK